MTESVVTVELPADPSSPSRARAVVERACAVAGIEPDTAMLCTSELVTNALLHGSPPIVVEVAVDLDHVSIAVRVHDAGGNAVEQRRPITADTLSGRGLTIVDALSSRWGTETTDDGNLAWFEISAERGGGL